MRLSCADDLPEVFMLLTEKTLSSKEIFNGRILRFTHDEVELPDGSRALREVVHHHGGV